MESLDKLIETVAKLRSPDGCPWDKEQTHTTLKRYLIEETYEAIDAIDKNDPKALMEELGDVLLQVLLHSQIASENKHFTIDDVAGCINNKMVKRHPHVFSDKSLKTSEEVLINWEKQKKEERKSGDIFDNIPNSLPALIKALKVSKKAAREGFEWKDENDLWNAFENELKELKEVTALNNNHRTKEKLEEELGDLLFMIVNLARWYKLDPEENLNKGIKKFITRFNRVKEKANKENKIVSDLSSDELSKLWVSIKEKEK